LPITVEYASLRAVSSASVTARKMWSLARVASFGNISGLSASTATAGSLLAAIASLVPLTGETYWT
jgi:hypothetical protein